MKKVLFTIFSLVIILFTLCSCSSTVKVTKSYYDDTYIVTIELNRKTLEYTKTIEDKEYGTKTYTGTAVETSCDHCCLDWYWCDGFTVEVMHASGAVILYNQYLVCDRHH